MKIGLYTDLSTAPELPRDQVAFIEENLQTFLVPESDESVFEERLKLARAGGYQVPVVNRFLPADLKIVGPSVDKTRLLRWAQTAMRRAEIAGVKIVVWGSGAARRATDGFPIAAAVEQYVDAVRWVAPVAQEHGVLIVIEPLSRGDSNVVMSIAEGAQVVDAVASPAVGLLADTWHMMLEGEPVSELERFASRLAHVHTSELKQRAVPGTFGDDLRPYLSALRRGGYKGDIVVEPEWKNVHSESRLAVTTLRAQMTDAGWPV